MYLIFRDIDPKDAVASAYDCSMQYNVQNKCKFVLGDMDSLCMSDEKKVADDSLPSNIIILKMSGESDENNAMDQWPDYSLNAPIEEDYYGISTYIFFVGYA